MKGNSAISVISVIFTSLHMKGKEMILKMEKYFDFFKMDKKNVQKFSAPIFYGKLATVVTIF
jgi:hypothetical protein